MSRKSPGRTRVKICGLTNRQDAMDAIALGVDALGFNTFRGSKRYINLEKESEWIRTLPPFVTKVVVMVNPSIAEAEAVFKMPFVDMVQFHGNEDEEFCAHFARLGLPFIKAVAVKNRESLESLGRFKTPYMLLDAYSQTEFGGTGHRIESDLLDTLAVPEGVHLILSGGLKPANVRSAIKQFRPYAVDVASGVESTPGRKDKELMADFILAATTPEA
jgi:phosphoribosylanthranilate isomerase